MDRNGKSLGYVLPFYEATGCPGGETVLVLAGVPLTVDRLSPGKSGSNTLFCVLACLFAVFYTKI